MQRLLREVVLQDAIKNDDLEKSQGHCSLFISPLPEEKSKYWSILDVNIKELKCKFIATHVRKRVNDKRSKLNLLSIRNLSSKRSGFVVTLICTGFIQRDTKVSFVFGFTSEH